MSTLFKHSSTISKAQSQFTCCGPQQQQQYNQDNDRYFSWFTKYTYEITFSDSRGLQWYRSFWAMPEQEVHFTWITKEPTTVIETDAYYNHLPNGFKSPDLTTNGDFTLELDQFTIQTHYYCVTEPNSKDKCRGSGAYRGSIIMHTSNSVFRTPEKFANQNYRFTFTLLALLMWFVLSTTTKNTEYEQVYDDCVETACLA